MVLGICIGAVLLLVASPGNRGITFAAAGGAAAVGVSVAVTTFLMKKSRRQSFVVGFVIAVLAIIIVTVAWVKLG